MKKILLLVTAFVALNPVLQVVASAEGMYLDIIKSIINDPLTGTNDNKRLNNVRETLKTLKYYKKSMEDSVLYLHSTEDNNKYFLLGMLAGSSGVAGAFGYVAGMMQLMVGAAAMMLTPVALLINYQRKIRLYYIKKKIKEINEVIIRLEAMEKELIAKIADSNKNYHESVHELRNAIELYS